MLLFHDNGLLLKTSEYVLWVKTMTPGVLSGLDKHHVTAVSPNQVVCGGSEPVRWFGQSHFESHGWKQHVWFRTEDVIFLTEHQERMYLPLFQLSFYYFCKLDVKHSSHSLFCIALLHKNNSLNKRTSAWVISCPVWVTLYNVFQINVKFGNACTPSGRTEWPVFINGSKAKCRLSSLCVS